MAARRLLLLAAGSVVACRAPTQLTFVLTTDAPCTNLQGTTVTAGSPGASEDKPATTSSTMCDANDTNMSAYMVLGQPDFTTTTNGVSATKLVSPGSTWTDGTRVLVADFYNNRVLLWTTFPTPDGNGSGSGASIALGQSVLTSNSASTSAMDKAALKRPFS